MENRLKPLISPADVLPLLVQDHLVVLDVRGGPAAQERYEKGHIEGAFFLDLDTDLSSKPADPAQGGRHPLPDVQVFAKLLGRLGITPASHVLVYDDKHGAMAAARCWWMLRAVGHEKVQVIDGGLAAIVEAGLPVTTTDSEAIAAKPYPVDGWKLLTADIEAVGKATKDPDAVVVDVREAYRFRGESEPIDLVAGHIPGAVNVPYLENLDENGRYLSVEKLREKYSPLVKDKEKIIVHCGSGVTACHTLLALEQAGLKGASLYVGSWSEWSRNKLPIGRGE